ncbi:hypothetical protein JCM10207_003713 [Rhodosporidiobolus poonsookiae]
MMNGVTPRVPNKAKEALDRDEVFSSMSIRLCTSVEIVGIAKAADFEAILRDMEHNSFSLSTANQVRLFPPAASSPLTKSCIRSPPAKAQNGASVD